MSVVAFVGEPTTTTALATAMCWPLDSDVALAELDPSGGDLAAWLDRPQSPGLAGCLSSSGSIGWPVIAAHIQPITEHFGVLVAPLRAREAAVAVREAALRLVPTLSALDRPVTLADCGSQQPSALSPVVLQAAITVVCVSQRDASARAVAARLDRTAELVDALRQRAMPVVVAVVGARPFAPDEIERFLAAGEPLSVAAIEVDPAAAAFLTGDRRAVRRFDRTPLGRSAAPLAIELSARLAALRAEVAA